MKKIFETYATLAFALCEVSFLSTLFQELAKLPRANERLKLQQTQETCNCLHERLMDARADLDNNSTYFFNNEKIELLLEIYYRLHEIRKDFRIFIENYITTFDNLVNTQLDLKNKQLEDAVAKIDNYLKNPDTNYTRPFLIEYQSIISRNTFPLINKYHPLTRQPDVNSINNKFATEISQNILLENTLKKLEDSICEYNQDYSQYLSELQNRIIEKYNFVYSISKICRRVSKLTAPTFSLNHERHDIWKNPSDAVTQQDIETIITCIKNNITFLCAPFTDEGFHRWAESNDNDFLQLSAGLKNCFSCDADLNIYEKALIGMRDKSEDLLREFLTNNKNAALIRFLINPENRERLSKWGDSYNSCNSIKLILLS